VSAKLEKLVLNWREEVRASLGEINDKFGGKK